MNSNKLLEFYAKYLWPAVRRIVHVSRRCDRCLLSEKYTPLEGGICKFCRDFKPNDAVQTPEASAEMRERFVRTIRTHITSARYHALLLLSGGKDSAYILHRIKSEFPELRIFAVIVNNGFMSPTAIPSAQFAAAKMKTDLLVCNAHTEEFARVLREAFLKLDERGSYGVVDFADGSLIFDIGQRVCAEMKIPLLLGGLTWVQLQKILGIDDFEMPPQGGARQVFPLALWRPNEQEIRKTVRDLKLLPPGSDSPLVSNSSLIVTMSALDVLNNGYSSFEPEFAQLIREGKSDRYTWLHTFELLEFGTRKGLFNKEMEQTLGRLNLRLSDVVKERR